MIMINDNVSVYFESSEDAYVYLFNIGTSGNVTPLFPNEHSSDNHVKGKKIYRFPDENADFEWILDGPAGTEIIKAFATKKPVDISKFADVCYPKRSTRDIRVAPKIKDVSSEEWAEAICTIVVQDNVEED